ncbi:response regulator [Haliangium sp.]|uniref:response regulator n=1 Tax=Haliangium sp. TaxID=2663208 RepID=UPI003D14F554
MAAAKTSNNHPRLATYRDARGEPIKVAVVDDDREMRMWLREVLEEAGFAVILATNGLRLVSTLQVDRPHLILLDVVNSWIDGFELCRALKQNQQFRDIPVIFLSGRSAPDDVRRGLSSGAVDYFAKPVDSRKLIARIHHLVAQRDGSLPPA